MKDRRDQLARSRARVGGRGFLSIFALLGACSPKATPTPAPPPVVTTAEAPKPADAALPPVDAAPDAWLESLVIGEVPLLAGPVTPVKERETVTVGGVAITFDFASHKHAVNGRSEGRWQFTAVRDGKPQVIEVETWGNYVEAEINAHGVFIQLRHTGYTSFDIVLVAAQAPAPLDAETCAARIEAAVPRAGLKRGNQSGTDLMHGIVELRDPDQGWIGHCGTLSQRLWFTKLPTR